MYLLQQLYMHNKDTTSLYLKVYQHLRCRQLQVIFICVCKSLVRLQHWEYSEDDCKVSVNTPITLKSHKVKVHTFQLWHCMLKKKKQFWCSGSKGVAVLHCSLSGISSANSSTDDRLDTQKRAVAKTTSVFQDAISKCPQDDSVWTVL